MGVSLEYSTARPVTEPTLVRILRLAEGENSSREWWCEPIWISEKPGVEGQAFGSTKLFCMIDDEDVDTYMAYLDIQEIARFLIELSGSTGTDWELRIEGSPVGLIRSGRMDEGLSGAIEAFLQ